MTESAFLDARGLLCPLPVLRARKALLALRPGDVLRVEATDPSSVKDFAAFCRATGHRLLASREVDGGYCFEIERAAAQPPAPLVAAGAVD